MSPRAASSGRSSSCPQTLVLCQLTFQRKIGQLSYRLYPLQTRATGNARSRTKSILFRMIMLISTKLALSSPCSSPFGGCLLPQDQVQMLSQGLQDLPPTLGLSPPVSASSCPFLCSPAIRLLLLPPCPCWARAALPA